MKEVWAETEASNITLSDITAMAIDVLKRVRN
jgi:hypothetical protein